MPRFHAKRQTGAARVAVSVAGCVAALAALWAGTLYIGRSATAQEAAKLADTVRQCAVRCYAARGFYPPDLAYMQAHYGLRFDTQRYLVHYRNNGSNLLPEIRILPQTR